MDSKQKYYDLFILGKEKLREEKQRYDRVDDKINRLLNIITLLIGISGFFGQWALQKIIPPIGLLEWSIFVVMVLFFITLLYSWAVILYADRLYGLSFPPLNDEMLSFFKDNKPIDIYYHLTINFQEALNHNRTKTDNKVWYLELTHKVLKATFFLLILIIVLSISYYWNLN